MKVQIQVGNQTNTVETRPDPDDATDTPLYLVQVRQIRGINEYEMRVTWCEDREGWVDSDTPIGPDTEALTDQELVDRGAVFTWETQGIYFTRAEAEAFVEAKNSYHDGLVWQSYGIPTKGTLKQIVRALTD